MEVNRDTKKYRVVEITIYWYFKSVVFPQSFNIKVHKKRIEVLYFWSFNLC